MSILEKKCLKFPYLPTFYEMLLSCSYFDVVMAGKCVVGCGILCILLDERVV